MPSGRRRRASRRRTLAVTVAAPDGEAAGSRGLGAWLAKAAPADARGEVAIALVSDGRIRALNRTFRGKDSATDVLSFPFEPATSDAPDAGRSLGDIVIATGVAARQADERGHTLATELRVLALHGLLHLLGYDHESDAGVMARVERRLQRRAGLREGLIERTQGRAGTPANRPLR